MSALEREIIEKFRQLDKPAQNRVRALIEQETAAEVAQSAFDYDEWFRTVEAVRQQIRANQGSKQSRYVSRASLTSENLSLGLQLCQTSQDA